MQGTTSNSIFSKSSKFPLTKNVSKILLSPWMRPKAIINRHVRSQEPNTQKFPLTTTQKWLSSICPRPSVPKREGANRVKRERLLFQTLEQRQRERNGGKLYRATTVLSRWFAASARSTSSKPPPTRARSIPPVCGEVRAFRGSVFVEVGARIIWN